MPLARNLRDLLEIRRHNAGFLRRIHGCLGTAVGFRYKESAGDFDRDARGRLLPSILVFVVEKIPEAALTRDTIVPQRFKGTGGRECFSDVIVGKPPTLIEAGPPTTGVNAHIVYDLHHTVVDHVGGVPIAGSLYNGTAGVIVQSPDGSLGALTNFHVAGFPGTRIRRLGAVYEDFGTTSDKSRLIGPKNTANPNDLESFSDDEFPFDHRVDIGFVALDAAAADKARSGVYGLTLPLGDPYRLVLDRRDFDPIGRYVVGVGQKLGRQEGRIIAYGYEWRSSLESDKWYATDYLIKSEGALPFAAPGDSGKLVVTNDARRQPIALLWGGENHYYGNVPAQATCAYATDIGLVLDLLGHPVINWQSVPCER